MDSPWSGLMGGEDIYSGMEQGQNNLMGMADQYNALATQDQYPSFPNQAGLGSQNAFMPTQSAAPQQKAQLDTAPMNAPGGPNPWMLSGEALAR